MYSSFLSSTLLLTLSVAASPVQVRSPRVSLPFAKRINTAGGATSLIQGDQARAATLRACAEGMDGNGRFKRPTTTTMGKVNVTNFVSSTRMTWSSTLGLPFWVGASLPYVQTNTSVHVGESMSLSFGFGLNHGSFSGEEWLDTVTLTPDLVIKNQPIGVTSNSYGLTPRIYGILGLGSLFQTLGTLAVGPNAIVPTIPHTLWVNRAIPEDVFSYSFEPSTSNYEVNGEVTFGGIDSSKYTGNITYSHLTSTKPSSSYHSFTYGDKIILSHTAGIVDSSTTMILLASDAYLADAFATGATLDPATGLLTPSPPQYDEMLDLNFNIESVSLIEQPFLILHSILFTLTPNAQLWPRALNSYVNSTSGALYLIVGDLGTPSGHGLDFINGQAFLERFYNVFDGTRLLIGFATTIYTNVTTN